MRCRKGRQQGGVDWLFMGPDEIQKECPGNTDFDVYGGIRRTSRRGAEMNIGKVVVTANNQVICAACWCARMLCLSSSFSFPISSATVITVLVSCQTVSLQNLSISITYP